PGVLAPCHSGRGEESRSEVAQTPRFSGSAVRQIPTAADLQNQEVWLPAPSRRSEPLCTTKREILRSVLRFFPLKCGSTCHFQVAAPCTLCDYQTLNTERPEHRRDLSVEASEAR